jgi:two-component system sensor histidine kinase/response regulator
MSPAEGPALFDLTMFDEAPVGLALCASDGRIIEVSEGLAAILGRRAADLVGRPYAEIVHPEDRAAVAVRMAQFLSGVAGRERHEDRYVRPDGEVRWVVVIMSRAGHGGAGAAPAVLRMVDITAGRRAEMERDRFLQQLERREAQLAEAQAIAHLGSWEYDFATQRTTCSEELFRIFGLDPATSSPDVTPLFELIHAGDRDAVRQAAWASFESGAPFSVECRITRADGAERVVHVRGRVSVDAAGHDRFVGTIQDITEAREAERARKALDSVRQALLERLSAQERQILTHIAAGRTNRQIARELSLAEKTVRNYVSNLLAKLGMHTRSEAAAFAARLEERGKFGPGH